MKRPPNPNVERYRIQGPKNTNYGAFAIPPKAPVISGLHVIASEGMGWDHLSISTYNRCPKWDELEFVKRLFFADHEWAMQLHAPPSLHKNLHPFCLHIWRPQTPEEVEQIKAEWLASGESMPKDIEEAVSPGSIPIPPIGLV